MPRRKGYDYRWDKLARRFIAEHPTCRVCGQPASHVDHIMSVKATPWRRYDETNLQSLCPPCHNQVTQGYDRQDLRGACDDQGRPLDPGHPWQQTTNAGAIRSVNSYERPSHAISAKLKWKACKGIRLKA